MRKKEMENLNDIIWNNEDDPIVSNLTGDTTIKGPFICIATFCSNQIISEYTCTVHPTIFTDTCLGL